MNGEHTELADVSRGSGPQSSELATSLHCTNHHKILTLAMGVATDRSDELLRVFQKLATEISKGEALGAGASGKEARLWRLPKNVVYASYNIITQKDQERARPEVAKLRERVVAYINALPGRREARARLCDRVRSARDRFSFRPWTMNDVDQFVSLLDDAQMWANVPEEYPNRLTKEIAGTLIEASNAAPSRHEVRAVEWEERLVGQVRLQFDASPQPNQAEISYWLGRPYWNMGLTTDFVALFTHESFAMHDEISHIVARVSDGNEPSIRVLEKIGFRLDEYDFSPASSPGNQPKMYTYSVFRADYDFDSSGSPSSERDETERIYSPEGEKPANPREQTVLKQEFTILQSTEAQKEPS